MSRRKGGDGNGSRGDHSVGYGRPPKHAQFRKGVSGNPAGRPKGARNKPVALQPGFLRDVFLREAQREIRMREGDHEVSTTMIEAVTRKVLVDAVKGNPRAQELVMKTAAAISAADMALNSEFQKAMIEYKFWAESVLANPRAHEFRTAPKLHLHPDDIVVDLENDGVYIRSKEQKQARDELRVLADALRQFLDFHAVLLAEASDDDERRQLEDSADRARAKLAMIEEALS